MRKLSLDGTRLRTTGAQSVRTMTRGYGQRAAARPSARAHTRASRWAQPPSCATDRRFVLEAPAQRRAIFPDFFEVLEAWYAARGKRREGPGADRVDANLVTAEIARQVTSHRFERGFRHTHPVVFRPRLRRVVEIKRN